jgi:hypothetical protein
MTDVDDFEYKRHEDEIEEAVEEANRKYGYGGKSKPHSGLPKSDKEADNNGNGHSNNKNSRDKDDDDKKKPAADRLIELVVQDSNLLFKDQYGCAHAYIYDSDHFEVIRVSSGAFKRHLIMKFHDSEDRIVNAETVTNVVNYLQAKAESRGQTYPLSVRVSLHDDSFYYDMTNEKWQSIKINKEGGS